MKCQFCGAHKEDAVARENNLVLCDKCENTRQEKENETMEDQKVININREEMPVAEEVGAPVPDTDIKAELVIGVRKDGSLYFTANGDGIDLLVIDGLLNFGKRRLKQIWDQRDFEMQKAAYEAQQKAAAEQSEQQ